MSNSESKQTPFWKVLKYTKSIIGIFIGILYFLGWVFNDAENVVDGLNQIFNMSWIEIISGILFVITLGVLALYVIYASREKAIDAVKEKYLSMTDKVNSLEEQVNNLEEKVPENFDKKMQSFLKEEKFNEKLKDFINTTRNLHIHQSKLARYVETNSKNQIGAEVEAINNLLKELKNYESH